MLSSTVDALDRLRPKVASLVERQERLSGSRMAAYEQVAAMVGTSASWIRKIVGRSDEASLRGYIIGKNVEALYDRVCAPYAHVCEWIEGHADQEDQQSETLRKQANAAAQGNTKMVEGMAATARFAETYRPNDEVND